jgi:hypothetical protein
MLDFGESLEPLQDFGGPPREACLRPAWPEQEARMFNLRLAAIAAAIGLSGTAQAAVTTYHVTFDIQGIAAPVERVNGNFSVTLDPTALPFTNDVAPTDANIWTPLVFFDESFSRVDFFPFSSSDPGFLIGWVTGGADTNNTTLNPNYDYRIRFILNPDYSIISARGQVRYWDGTGGYPTVGFDTAAGRGSIAAWSIMVDGGGGGAVVPEPATWGLMIAGFGLVGASARRQRAVSVPA